MKEIIKKFKISGLNQEEIKDFIKIEMLLTIIKKFNLECDINRGYYILCGYDLIKNDKKNADDFILQNARIILKKLKSKRIYKKQLEKYCNIQDEKLRYYQFEEIEVKGKIEKRIKEIDTSEIYYNNRIADYINYLTNYKSFKNKSFKYVEQGKYTYFNKNSKKEKIVVELKEELENENIANNENENLVNLVPKETIKITYEELEEAAIEMKKIDSNKYSLEVLKNNKIKEIADNNIIKAKEIEIDKVVNIIGMVGAGKSTLLKILTYILNKRNKKVVIVTDTVAEVFKLYKYFKNLNCNCSPFVGKSDREKYINMLLKENEEYLEEDLSVYLTPYCILDGKNVTEQNAINFGEEPCVKLKEVENKKNRVCKYFNICPVTKMQRDVEEKNIVITTIPGMIMGRVGKTQKIFFEKIFKNFDLIFFDECDRAQKELDRIFTPVLSFDEYLLKGSTHFGEYIKKRNSERMKEPLNRKYNELLLQAYPLFGQIIDNIEMAKEIKQKTPIEETFSSYTILENIKDIANRRGKNYFKNIIKNFEIFLENKEDKKNIDEELEAIFNISYLGTENEKINEKLKLWLKKKERLFSLDREKKFDEKGKKIEEELRENWQLYKLSKLFLILVYLDEFIVKIESAYEDLEGIEADELSNFLKKRFFKLQEYLPSALMGNLFGIKTKENKDILLYKQYAFGRSIMTDLPYLKINEKGEGLGPHVVLFSGSSYVKGSLEYHVNVDVKYIIETSKEIRNYIENTKFKEIKSNFRISGSPLEIKNELLGKMTIEIGDYIIKELEEKEGKILIVVNSYEQTKIVAQNLKDYFLAKRIKEKIYRLISNSDIIDNDTNETITRGEISNFLNYDGRVLIAPAISIERGHNITDAQGHSLLSSVFFFIRPLGVPDDLENKITTLNGYISQEIEKFKNENIFEKNKKIRLEAIKFWYEMNKKVRLDNLENETLKINIIATMFVLILQIFGRLCRVTDLKKESPTVYFVDGAFRKKDDDIGFDTLNEFYNYLSKNLSDSKEGKIFKTLYEPFFNAYKEGIEYEK